MTILTDTGERRFLFSTQGFIFLALIVTVLSWVGLWYFYTWIGIEYPISDPKTYWDGSTRLVDGFFKQPELIFSSHHRDHVPGYPALIALIRGLSGWNNPELMRLITLIGWVTNLGVVYKILEVLKVQLSLRVWGMLLYGVFPLVGMSLAVHPISDTIALLFLTTGVLFYLLRRYALMAGFLAGALLIHKFTWPGVFIILAIGLWQRRMSLPIAALTVSPLAAYWVAISLHYGDPLYLVGGNINVGLESQRQFPLFDGLLQTLLEGAKGSFPDAIKGFFVIAILGVCLWLLISKIWKAEKVLLAFVLPVLIWGMLSAPYLLFVVVRLAKVLVIPALIYINDRPNLSKHARVLLPMLVVLSLLSQFAFTYYQTDFYD